MGGDKIVQISVSDQTLTLWQHKAPIQPTVVPKIASPIFFGQHAEKIEIEGIFSSSGPAPPFRPHFGAADIRLTS